MLKWMAIIAVLYIAFAIAFVFAANDLTLISMPFGLALFAIEWVRRPPRWRLERAVRSLHEAFAARLPAIIESRTAEWSPGSPTVYLVCANDAEVAPLRSQLAELRISIAQAGARWHVSETYLATVRLWPVSRPAIDREGGWFGFDHNVPFPDDE